MRKASKSAADAERMDQGQVSLESRLALLEKAWWQRRREARIRLSVGRFPDSAQLGPGRSVDEADAPQLLGAQSGAGKSHLSQKGLGHKASDALCAGPTWRRADRRLGKTKYRVGRGHTDIAGRCKLEATAKYKASSRTEHGNRKGGHAIEKPMPRRDPGPPEIDRVQDARVAI